MDELSPPNSDAVRDPSSACYVGDVHELTATRFVEARDEVTAVEASGAVRVLVRRAPGVDPFVLAAALAAVTSTIRLVVEVDTGRVHPYVVARKLAALDKISHGRVEWRPHDTVDGRREEAVALVEALLSSWHPRAVLNDRERGVHVDTDRITAVHHDGVHWSVHSPLDVPAGPQGVVPREAGV